MPAATNTRDLLAITVREHDRLQSLIANLPAAQALRKRDDDTSITEVIAHRAH